MYYKCAKEFGWTIEETANQPVMYLDWVINISDLVKELERDQQ